MTVSQLVIGTTTLPQAGARPAHATTPPDGNTQVPIAAAVYGTDGLNEYQVRALTALSDGVAANLTRLLVDSSLALFGTTATNAARDLSATPTATGAGVLAVGAQTATQNLSPGAPTPAGSDITGLGGVALTPGDFRIRDMAAHGIVIPMAGWSALSLYYQTLVDVNQPMTLRCGLSSATGGFHAALLEIVIPVGGIYFGIGPGAVGVGGVAGAASAAVTAWYGVDAFSAPSGYAFFVLYPQAAPTAGEYTLGVVRRR